MDKYIIDGYGKKHDLANYPDYEINIIYDDDTGKVKWYELYINGSLVYKGKNECEVKYNRRY